MNIFVCDTNPKLAAAFLPDKLVVKMPLESAQMACTVLRSYGCEDVPYKATHAKHPCTIWAAKTRANFDWLIAHGLSLCEEYSRRYSPSPDSPKVHKCQEILDLCKSKREIIPFGELLPFAQAMPDQYRNEDAVMAYRSYLIAEKTYYAKWTNTIQPTWWM
jgi:hypothetical protein